MERKALGALALAACLLAGCAGGASGKGGYTPGDYTGSAKGYGGVVTVTVTVDENKVTNVQAVGPDETESIGGAALQPLASAILEKGSAEIDGISGATLTSNAVKEAARAALEQAKQKKS